MFVDGGRYALPRAESSPAAVHIRYLLKSFDYFMNTATTNAAPVQRIPVTPVLPSLIFRRNTYIVRATLKHRLDSVTVSQYFVVASI